MSSLLGALLQGSFKRAFDGVNPALLATFVKEDESYLCQMPCGDQLFIGKFVGVAAEIPQLELSAEHLRSLLKRILPEFPVESLPLYLIPADVA